MLATAGEARNRVCLMVMAGRDHDFDAGSCRGDECSAWHWEEAKRGAGAGERLGYCGMIGCVERAIRKHPRRMVEATVAPP